MATNFDEFGNVIEEVTADELVAQQNAEFESTGGADDDSGSSSTYYENDGTASSTKAETKYYENDGTGTTASGEFTPATSSQTTANAGSTVNGKPGTTATPAPGKRMFNPLSKFSSYTYQLSLYMITPDAYDAFIQSGRTNLNAISNTANPSATAAFNNSGAGVYLVAQSGGINNSTSLRAPGFDLDYYIDDLRIATSTNGKSSGTSSNVTSIRFKIFEPYGFSFITKLQTAAGMLQQYSKLKNFKDLENPSRQFFLLGIRFQGYDANGNVVTANDVNTTGQMTGSNGTFEKFYDILITSIKFKLDGKATTYNIEAAATAPQLAMGVKRGRLLNDVTATASTFEEALVGDGYGIQGLFTQLNQQQKDMVGKGIEIPNVYKIKFIGPDADLLKSASIISKSDIEDKTKLPMVPIKDTNQVTVKESVNATPDTTKKNILFKNDTPITQAIQLLVSQSQFVEDALKVLYTTDVETDNKTDSPNDIPQPGNKRTLKWYNVSTEVKNLGFDKKTNDFAYEITYIFQTYETPIVQSFAAGKTSKYYGPHKRYEYWFTGKNTEIIDYSQNLDNQYFNVAIEPLVADSAATGGATDIPLVAYKRQSVARQGRTGIGAEANNSYVNYLLDPGSQATAKITILGDPDFLIQESSSSINALYNRFYGTDGFSINANGGQVFIEIDFKEGIDYNNQNGLMDINNKIMFWKYPKSIASKIKGISYMVIEVISNFKGGKFTQELSCVVNTFSDVTDDPTQANRESNTTPTGSREGNITTTDANNPTGSNATGLTPAPEVYDEFAGYDEAVAYQSALNESEQADLYYNGNNQSTSPTGGGLATTEVADDENTPNVLIASGISFDDGRET